MGMWMSIFLNINTTVQIQKNELFKIILQQMKYMIFFKSSTLLLILLIGLSVQVFAQVTNPVEISSPDGKIKFKLDVQKGELKYTVYYNKLIVLGSSRLGLQLNGKSLGETSIIGKVKRFTVNEKYAYRGVHSTAVNEYNGAKFLVNGTNPFSLETRVFNNGIAFRYLVDNKDSAIVEKDETQFSIPAGSIIWSQPNIKYYEGKYGNQLVDTMKVGALIGPPATIEIPNNLCFVAITEGGLTNFAGMSLKVIGKNMLQSNLTGNTHLFGNIETPWRIIEIGKDLNTLVNCDIIADVSTPYNKKLFPKGYETDWVKPGRSVWSWLAVRRSVTLENMKRFTDYAAQLGFEYNLVDEGWANWKDSINHRDNWDMMKELVDYSTTKGIKIWVWKAYPNRKGIPGIKDPEQRKAFFKKCSDLGIAGLKVDFFDSEAQDIVQFYQAALKDAAEYHLMMDFHGANKPTGEARTWPNEMSREAIRGLENRPPHAYTNTILPFTRYLAGHADFTPVHFGDRLGESTWANQVASMVIFTSPFLCLGADPQSILDNPCKAMIQSIPTVWDETIVLPQSKIGELALFARRKGNTWFLAAMNGSKEPTTLLVDASFLGSGTYKLSMVKDDGTKQANAILENTTTTSAKPITIKINAFGGLVGRFDK